MQLLSGLFKSPSSEVVGGNAPAGEAQADTAAVFAGLILGASEQAVSTKPIPSQGLAQSGPPHSFAVVSPLAPAPFEQDSVADGTQQDPQLVASIKDAPVAVRSVAAPVTPHTLVPISSQAPVPIPVQNEGLSQTQPPATVTNPNTGMIVPSPLETPAQNVSVTPVAKAPPRQSGEIAPALARVQAPAPLVNGHIETPPSPAAPTPAMAPATATATATAQTTTVQFPTPPATSGALHGGQTDPARTLAPTQPNLVPVPPTTPSSSAPIAQALAPQMSPQPADAGQLPLSSPTRTEAPSTAAPQVLAQSARSNVAHIQNVAGPVAHVQTAVPDTVPEPLSQPVTRAVPTLHTVSNAPPEQIAPRVSDTPRPPTPALQVAGPTSSADVRLSAAQPTAPAPTMAPQDGASLNTLPGRVAIDPVQMAAVAPMQPKPNTEPAMRSRGSAALLSDKTPDMKVGWEMSPVPAPLSATQSTTTDTVINVVRPAAEPSWQPGERPPMAPPPTPTPVVTTPFTEFPLPDRLREVAHLLDLQGSTRTGAPAPELRSTGGRFSDAILGQIRTADVSADRMKVELHPRGLGHIDIEIANDPLAGVRVTVRAENPHVLQALRDDRAILAQVIGVNDDTQLEFSDRQNGNDGENPAQSQTRQSHLNSNAQAHSTSAPVEHHNVINGRQLDIVT